MDGLKEVQEQLIALENILKAEKKRRTESNEIMDEYIGNYLDQLQQSLNDRVNVQFNQLKRAIDGIDSMMTKAEKELDFQEQNIRKVIDDKKKQSEREIVAAEHLLKNVKGSFRVQKEKMDEDQEKLIKEVQSILKNDSLQWDQIRTQVRFRLQKLQSFDKLQDYAESFTEVADLLEKEAKDREESDQDIIDMLNTICIKMYSRLAKQE